MRAFLLCLLISSFPAAAYGKIVDQMMRPGIPASAEYLPGDRHKPAILLVHGFLQTREFRTVASLSRGLHDAGYSLLVPTLSLDIPQRRQSLACEAVHNHTLDDDLAEIARWVAWLKSQGHHHIVLIGHSFGSLQLLAYLIDKPDAAIKAYIGISLIETQVGKASRTTLIADLENRVQHKPRNLVRHPLSFCRNYLSTPEGLLSYVRWDQAHTLAALKQSPVSIGLIMGDSDEMMGRDWLKALKHIQMPMTVVRDANHFMDGEHEFDLLDLTLKHLDNLKPPPR